MTPLEQKIVDYFLKAVDEEGVSLDKGDLECMVKDGDVILKSTRWLPQGWAEIMDYVLVFNGEWISDKKNSHWLFPLEMIQDRFDDEEEERLESWLRLIPRDTALRLIGDMELPSWGHERLERLRAMWFRYQEEEE